MEVLYELNFPRKLVAVNSLPSKLSKRKKGNPKCIVSKRENDTIILHFMFVAVILPPKRQVLAF